MTGDSVMLDSAVRRLCAVLGALFVFAVLGSGVFQLVQQWTPHDCGSADAAALAVMGSYLQADFCDDGSGSDTHLYADDHPAEGPEQLSPPGGLYEREVKSQPGHERHHMPAQSTTGRPRNCTPAIRMETADHRETASWGPGRKPQAYRQKQERLVKAGKFEEAFELDVQDIRSKFRNKYDLAIELARLSLKRMC